MLTFTFKVRPCLALLALALLMLWPGAGMARGAETTPSPYSPERCITLDIPMMSPPLVVPSGLADERIADQAARMEASSAQQGGGFTWRLRYPVDVQRWPVLVLRYRAENLAAGPVYGQQVVQLDLRSGTTVTRSSSLIVKDLVQDGALHEARLDLSGVPRGALAMAINFTFHPVTGSVGRLDIFAAQFEQPAASGAPLASAPVTFMVTDAKGNPVRGAEVRAGILERANWTTVGRTGTDGKVTLTTILPPPAEGAAAPAAPIEAAIAAPGYLSEYVAPLQVASNGSVAVSLKTAAVEEASTPTPAAPSPTPPYTADQPTYTPTYDYGTAYDGGYYYDGYYGGPYGYYGGSYYYGPYASGWWIPWYCWPNTFFTGSVVVFQNHHHDGDFDRDDHFAGQHFLHNDPHVANRPMALTSARVSEQARARTNARAADSPAAVNMRIARNLASANGTISTPAHITAPSNRVITAPSERFVSAPIAPGVGTPSAGIVTAPSARVVSAPSSGVMTAPSARVSSAPPAGVTIGRALGAPPVMSAPSSHGDFGGGRSMGASSIHSASPAPMMHGGGGGGGHR